jgi:hypothetical protein
MMGMGRLRYLTAAFLTPEDIKGCQAVIQLSANTIKRLALQMFYLGTYVLQSLLRQTYILSDARLRVRIKSLRNLRCLAYTTHYLGEAELSWLLRVLETAPSPSSLEEIHMAFEEVLLNFGIWELDVLLSGSQFPDLGVVKIILSNHDSVEPLAPFSYSECQDFMPKASCLCMMRRAKCRGSTGVNNALMAPIFSGMNGPE